VGAEAAGAEATGAETAGAEAAAVRAAAAAAAAGATNQLEMCECIVFLRRSTFCCCADSVGLLYSYINRTHNSIPISQYTTRKPEHAESTVPAEHMFLHSSYRRLCIVSSY
jgi:hypothetical protein